MDAIIRQAKDFDTKLALNLCRKQIYVCTSTITFHIEEAELTTRNKTNRKLTNNRCQKLKLELENFRGIKQGSITLGDLNILIGANNAGKTTILESLFLAPNPLRDVYNKPAIDIIRLLHSTLGSTASISILHNYSSKTASIICTINEQRLEVKFQRKGSVIEVGMVEDGTTSIIGELEVSGGWKSRVFGVESKVVGEALYFHPFLIKDIWRYFSYNWVEYRALGLTSRIAEKISEGVAEGYDDLLLEPFIGGEQTIYLRSRDGRGVRLGDVGSGVQVLITLMLLHESIKPRMMLIDDVESHMNPYLLMRTTRWFSEILEGGTRLVISTHSLEAAEYIAKTLEEHKPQIILLALRNGILSTKTLTTEELEEVEKAGIDPRVAEGVLI